MRNKQIHFTENNHWWDVQFYQGLLRAKDAIAARTYVILADEAEDNPLLIEGASLANDMLCSASCPENSPQESRLNDSEDTLIVNPKLSCDGVSFYMYKKKDVLPPPLMRTLPDSRVSRCFRFCCREGCGCERPHIQSETWRLRVDTLKPISLTVCAHGQNRRLSRSDIIPTAGYYFALGLLEVKAVQAVVPTLCRFNLDCKHGCYCLYIHANVDATSGVVHDADTPLRAWIEPSALRPLSRQEQDEFFRFLSEKGVETVGDLQILGNPAFECLLASVPPRWVGAALAAGQLRHFDTKAPLAEVLRSFPRVRAPVRLPEGLARVRDLRRAPWGCRLPAHFPWAPPVLNACELVRARLGLDRRLRVARLAREPAGSFLARVTALVVGRGGGQAHCSWRKHNPTRTVVTSVLTYVDVRACRCGCDGNDNDNGDADCDNGGGDGERGPAPADNDADALPDLPPIPPEAALGCPAQSWCTCPRRWEVGVNYELSTPSGSRCSEQNAMGRLAALGVPTWSVRELFVHGANAKNVNPLFPCGVCDNMLQKVDKDVRARYGGEIQLFMFDATVPTKVVYLPISETCQRAGSSFRRLVENDLLN